MPKYKLICDFCKKRANWSFKQGRTMKAVCGTHGPKYGLPKK